MRIITVDKLKKTYETPIRTGNWWNDTFHRVYKKHEALRGISFTAEKGELIGLLGPNGAGKTTLMKLLSGILYPTEGSMTVLGQVPFEKKPAFLKRLGFVMGQRYQLMWDLPALDSYEVLAAIYELPKEVYKKNMNELVELLDAQELIIKPVKSLSLGQRMRVELIGSLLHKPEVLFLDEPTIGLDVAAQNIVLTFLKTYQKEYQPTILFTSHYMRDVERLADRVLLINQGSLLFDGTLDVLLKKATATKTIVVTLDERIQPVVIAAIKKQWNVSYDHPVLSITVERSKLQEALSWVLTHCRYGDIDIRGEAIEETIERLFQRKRSL